MFLFIFALFSGACGDIPHQEPNGNTDAGEDPIMDQATEVVLFLGDILEEDSLVCDLSFILLYTLGDDDVRSDYVTVENFGDDYHTSVLKDALTGMVAISDQTWPRDLCLTSGTNCHLETHASSIHFYEGEELVLTVENCSWYFAESCELCKQVGFYLPGEAILPERQYRLFYGMKDEDEGVEDEPIKPAYVVEIRSSTAYLHISPHFDPSQSVSFPKRLLTLPVVDIRF